MQEQLSFLTENYFDHTRVKSWQEIPLPDEPFFRDWEKYIDDISRRGFMAALKKRLVQLNFPVKEGEKFKLPGGNQKRDGYF